jgi:hypothetical protein
LLLYEKIEGNLLTIDFDETNTKYLVTNVLRLFKLQAISKDIRVIVDLESVSNIFIQADISKFSQVIRNIMSNALKFTPSGGTVNVSAELLVKCPNGNNWTVLQRNGKNLHDICANGSKSDGDQSNNQTELYVLSAPSESRLLPCDTSTDMSQSVPSSNGDGNNADSKQGLRRGLSKEDISRLIISLSCDNDAKANSDSSDGMTWSASAALTSSRSQSSTRSQSPTNASHNFAEQSAKSQNSSQQQQPQSSSFSGTNDAVISSPFSVNMSTTSSKTRVAEVNVSRSNSPSHKTVCSAPTPSTSSKWLMVNTPIPSTEVGRSRCNSEKKDEAPQYKVRISFKDTGRGISIVSTSFINIK